MRHFKGIIVASFVILATVISTLHTLPAAAASSASMSIVPTKNYLISPGKTTKDTLVITNLDSTNSLLLSLKVIDFTYTDDGGTPKLLIAANQPQTAWSLKPYLTVPESVIIAPDSTKTINMSVSIPADHTAGSLYSAILYQAGNGAGGNVDLSASGVTLVFVTIPGKVSENLTLQKFGAYEPITQTTTPGYVSITADKPDTIAYTLKNAGNVTEAPAGSITLQYMFGKKQTISNLNPSGSLALIGQTRTFTTCIKLQAQKVTFNGAQQASTTCATPDLWPGYYKTSLDLFYGLNGNNTQEIVGSSSFWYLPWWFVVTSLIILSILALVVWRLVRRVRLMLYGPRTRSLSRRR